MSDTPLTPSDDAEIERIVWQAIGSMTDWKLPIFVRRVARLAMLAERERMRERCLGIVSHISHYPVSENTDYREGHLSACRTIATAITRTRDEEAEGS